MEICEHHAFRVTRNEDFEVEEDDAENLLKALERELVRRRLAAGSSCSGRNHRRASWTCW